MKLIVYSRHQRLGASSRYRSIQYFPILEQFGIEVVHRPFFTDNYLTKKANKTVRAFEIARAYIARFMSLLRESRQYNTVFFEKELLPFTPHWIEVFFLKRFGASIIDFDDAIWHAYDRSRWRLIRKIGASKFPALVKQCNLTIAGSHYLQKQCNDWMATECLFIPTSIPNAKYFGQGLAQEKNADVVWIGSDSTLQYLDAIMPALGRIAESFKISVRVIGPSRPGDRQYPSFVQYIPWSEKTEVDLLATSRVGIMPLPDEPFERGKCAFKLIQYMGVGIPFIASPVGENKFLCSANLGGISAESESEWIDAITRLLQSESTREQMGKHAYTNFLNGYTTEANGQNIATSVLRISSHK